MQIYKNGKLIYSFIDNTGSSDKQALGAKKTLGLITSIINNINLNYSTTAEVQKLIAEAKTLYVEEELPANPKQGIYYIGTEQPLDVYVVDSKGVILNVGTTEFDVDKYVEKITTQDKIYGTDNLGKQTALDKHTEMGQEPSNNAILTEKAVSDELDKKEDVFRYATMPAASATYNKKIVQYIGDTSESYINGYFYECLQENNVWKWVVKSVQAPTAVRDLSALIRNNEFNKTNLDIDDVSAKCFMGITTVKTGGILKEEVKEINTDRIKLMELPALESGYSYDKYPRVNIVRPAGFYMNESYRHRFYDNDGEGYINPNIGEGSQFSAASIVPITGAYNEDGEPILIGQQTHNHRGYPVYMDQQTPKMTFTQIELIEGSAENPPAYTLLMAPGYGYKYVDTYYTREAEGTLVPHKGDFFYLNEVNITIDKQYLYYCRLFDKMKEYDRFNIVNAQGQLCECKVTPSQETNIFSVSQASAFPIFKYGASGVVTFEPIAHNEIYTQIDGMINDANELSIGATYLKEFNFTVLS